MVTKTEALYRALLKKKVVSFDDVVQAASNIIDTDTLNRRYVYRKYVDRMVKSGKLRKVRKSLYLVLSPLEEPNKHTPDKLLIASKIRDEYYLGFHTALEYYGCASSFYNETYIGVKPKHRFDGFKYKRFSFRPVFAKDVKLEVEEKSYRENILKVSSKERTFIDCVYRVNYAGGWEECIKSLEGLSRLKVEKLPEILHHYRNDLLSRRVGYVLELLRERSPFYQDVTEQLLNTIRKQITGPPRYLIQKENGTLNKRWKLYVPEDFEKRLRGI